MIRVLVVPVGAPARVEELSQPTYEPLRRLLDGGWLEGIGGDGWAGYCDEEGKLKGLSVNVEATRLAHYLGWPHSDVLCGPVVFVGPTDDVGDDTSVTDAVVESARHLGAVV